MPKAVPEQELLSRNALKAACWYTVSKMIEDEEVDLGVTPSEAFAAALTEAVFAQALTLGSDLESFAKHAGRTTIQVEDVKLATRRNEMLYELIQTEATKHGLAPVELKADKPAAAKKPRARKLAADGEAAPVRKRKAVVKKGVSEE